MINFQLTMPTKIYFGKDAIKKIGKELSNYNKILLVSGGGSLIKSGLYYKVFDEIKNCNVSIYELQGVQPNPDIEKVREGVNICKKNKIDLIIGFGGGSVIDASKAIATSYYYVTENEKEGKEVDPWDLFLDEKKVKKALPIGAILTLAATGSETNGNSVISNRETKQKLAIHNDCIRPKFAILDPQYTFTVNKYHTAAGSADIMAHVFEQYFSPTKDTYLIDRIAEGILRTVIKYTEVVLKDPENYEARAQILYSSTLALNGLLSSGRVTDWACHAMEHEISATHDVTHGAGLAILFPSWMKYVLNEETIWRFVDYAENVWNIKEGDDVKKANLAIEKTSEFFKNIGLPSKIRDLNIPENFIDIWTKNLVTRRKSIGNYKVLFENDIKNIYKNSY
ncbi:MAG: iron-containing alcohol dehydrogenase [Spirochaetes bacterium]|nr:iron-containing alcohol dehydrogenase [Spirochaetota bacterium]